MRAQHCGCALGCRRGRDRAAFPKAYQLTWIRRPREAPEIEDTPRAPGQMRVQPVQQRVPLWRLHPVLEPRTGQGDLEEHQAGIGPGLRLPVPRCIHLLRPGGSAGCFPSSQRSGFNPGQPGWQRSCPFGFYRFLLPRPGSGAGTRILLSIGGPEPEFQTGVPLMNEGARKTRAK